MEGISDLYLITNLLNGKKYIGQTKSMISGRIYGMKQRWNSHKNKAINNKKRGCTYLYSAIRKYGVNNFSIELILMCTEDLIDNLEIEYIQQFSTLYPNGYNIERGGRKIKYYTMKLKF
jgi:group I intron endonuclease